MAATFTIPFPPTTNHIWISRGKARFRSAEYVAFVKTVGQEVMANGVPCYGAERLRVAIELHAPNKRRFDIDNRAKATLDALKAAGVMDDDEQVDQLFIARGEIMKTGCAVVTIDRM